MDNQYRHLSAEERAVIMIEHGNGASLRAIARRLDRNASTIAREIERNRSLHAALALKRPFVYEATSAGMAYRSRRRNCVRARKLEEGSALSQHVHDRLINWRWSPQQIAARLRRMHPDDPSRQVSHETIYAAIYAYPRGALKKGMIEALRESKPIRGRRRTTIARGQAIPEALRIVHRPEEIAERKLPGHWEGDFIKGAYNRSGVGTLVERKTRFVGVVPDGRLHGPGRAGGIHAPDEEAAGLPAREPDLRSRQ